MNWFSVSRLCRKRNRFTPGLEILEDRTTPAVTVTQSGSTLSITGDAGNNLVQIVDTGTGGVRNITVYTESSTTTTDGVTPITRIVIDTQGGNDSVSYQCFTQFTSRMSVEAYLGEGNDFFVGQTQGPLQTNTRLQYSVVGGNGNDQLIAQVLNSILGGAHLSWDAYGQSGNDVSTMTFVGTLNAGARLTANVDLADGDDGWDTLIEGTVLNSALEQFSAFGGAGNDVLDSTFRTDHVNLSRTTVTYQGGSGTDNVRVNAGGDVDVDAGAELTFLLDGGTEPDYMLLQHGGRVNGLFNGILDGSSGNNNIKATQFLNPGSTPTRATDVWRVSSGSGNSTLRLQLQPKSFSSSVVNGIINAGGGTDTCFRTPNVTANGCEFETVV